MTARLYLDLETASDTPIKDGVYRYAENARITLCAYACDAQEPFVMEWSSGSAQALLWLIHEADQVLVHNAEFDFTLLKTHGVDVPTSKRYCTMAQARRHGLPGGLDKLSEIFKLPEDKAKMKAGHALILLFCKPDKAGNWATKQTHPKEWAEFKEYARIDVVAMRELHKLMPTWNDAIEAPIWRWDHQMNARGFQVDTDFARAAVTLLQTESKRSAADISERTDDYVQRATQRNKLLAFLLAEYGVDLPDLTASTLERRLNDETLPDGVRELLRLRQDASKSSTSKYATLLRCVNTDGRLRGTQAYCGASRTGRFAGAKFQPHNLPSRFPSWLNSEEIKFGIRAIKAQTTLVFDDAHPLASYASAGVRGVVIPTPGNKLLVSDLKNIEGRIGAWVAGEHWKLDAYRAFDQGKGPDLYKLAAGRAFNIELDQVSPRQRQIGKVMELFLQYGGGVGAFITGAETYGIDLEAMAQSTLPQLPTDVLNEASSFWGWAQTQRRTYGLSRDVFVACDGLKRLYRQTNPNIEATWGDLETAVKVVLQGGQRQEVGNVEIDRVGSWLRIRLPSGRYLCYPGMRKETDGTLTYLGHSPYTRAWGRQKTWGGTLFENICQALAREALCYGVLEAEAEGLPVVLTVHDEAVADVPLDRTVKELEDCMTRMASWMGGLPLAAEGFEANRYGKN